MKTSTILRRAAELTLEKPGLSIWDAILDAAPSTMLDRAEGAFALHVEHSPENCLEEWGTATEARAAEIRTLALLLAAEITEDAGQ